MVKVIAKDKGYFGGVVRELGATFDIPETIWNDEKRRPKWCAPAPSGGKGDGDGDGKAGSAKPLKPSASAGETKPPETVTVPADWQNLPAAERKALARAITGQNSPNVKDADEKLAAYVEANKPAAFSDAPAPETVKSEVQEALGGVQPDWVAPTGAPKAVAD